MKHNSADYIHTVVEALKLAYADRDSYYGDPAFVADPGRRPAVEGLCQRARQADRSAARLARLLAGNPLPFDSQVKTWNYWVANLAEAGKPGDPAVDPEPIAGADKDTTHISIIDKDGNIFDSTPSGGWIGGAVILGNTGIGMSVRGEQFWLDKTPRRAAAAARAPALYAHAQHRAAQWRALHGDRHAPAATTRSRPSSSRSSNVVEFWPDWYPNLHEAFEWPRVQTLHFYGSFWPHNSGFNKLNLEANIPDAVFKELQARGHDVSRVRAVRHQWLRDRGPDRSRERQPHRRRRSAPRLLRDGVLGRISLLCQRMMGMEATGW